MVKNNALAKKRIREPRPKNNLCVCGCGKPTRKKYAMGCAVRVKSESLDALAPGFAERVRLLLNYNPDTGVFTSRIRRAQDDEVGAVCGHVNRKGYRVIKVRGKAYKAHRLAVLYVLGFWPPELVDHINGVKDDNRIANLRLADASLNAQNRRTAGILSKSGVLGVYPGSRANGKWIAALRYKNKVRHLGTYPTLAEAQGVYLVNKRALHPGCTI